MNDPLILLLFSFNNNALLSQPHPPRLHYWFVFFILTYFSRVEWSVVCAWEKKRQTRRNLSISCGFSPDTNLIDASVCFKHSRYRHLLPAWRKKIVRNESKREEKWMKICVYFYSFFFFSEVRLFLSR